jgi:hypothetical protein
LAAAPLRLPLRTCQQPTFPRESRTRHTPTHPVLASQNRVHLVPDDRLIEIGFVPLQKWLVVDTVRVPTTYAEPTPGLQYSRSIAEPPSQRAIELLLADEVVRQPTVVGSQPSASPWLCPGAVPPLSTDDDCPLRCFRTDWDQQLAGNR